MIRKIVALAMLSLLMFNMGGYFVLYAVLEKTAESSLNASIVDGDAEFVEFKLSFEMPYPVYSQRVDFEQPERLKSGDATYAVTSHEYADNTLTIVSVHDQWAMHVDAVMAAFNKAVSGEERNGNLLHGLSTLFSLFLVNDEVLLVQKNSWKRIIEPIDYKQYFASIALPSDPHPPCA